MKAVFFDMDGVILDDEYYYIFDIKRFFDMYGIDKDEEYIKRYSGSSHEEFCEDVARLKHCSHQEAERIRQEYNKLYPIDFKSLLKEDALFLLDYLKKKNYIICLTTSASKENTITKIDVCGIMKYFDFVITRNDVEKGKPFPDIYLEAVNKVKLNKEDCIAIEDSVFGMKSAKSAGLKVILDYDSRFNPDDSLADYKVNNLKEVVNILEDKLWQTTQRS